MLQALGHVRRNDKHRASVARHNACRWSDAGVDRRPCPEIAGPPVRDHSRADHVPGDPGITRKSRRLRGRPLTK